ncbi:hypothetical protein QBC36DRAFT_288977 [Triangularia setosa]|uniref:Uncharacterized protein n=1 Tax=Triangularia setosa TaxID=2587417 RepID=A0AAN6WA11_9PEZI|nr:hypothetical protein QBC36DRAFT_288977 [Podospora setosa]
MPVYYTPPPTPPPAIPFQSPPPSPRLALPAPGSYPSYPSSHSSRSNSKSIKSSLSSSSSKSKHSNPPDNHEGGNRKIPYVFLGSIAAASLLAHKYWPKGYIYGDKEDWELSKYERKAKERLQAEKAAKRGKLNEREVKGYSGRSPPPPPAYEDKEARRARYAHRGPPPVSYGMEEYEEHEEVHSNPGSRRGSLTGAVSRGRIDPRDYYRDDREYSRGRPEYDTTPSALKSRSQSGRDHFYSTVAPSSDRCSDIGSGSVYRPATTQVYTRSTSRDRSLPLRRTSSVVDDEYYMTPAIGPAADRNRNSYYPPAPQRSCVAGRETSRPRYLIEEPRVEPSFFARSESSWDRESQRRSLYDDDYAAIRAPKEEVLYVYRDAPSTRSRRASVDLGAGRHRAFDWGYC